MTAAFLSGLGFDPAATEKSSKLYRKSDFLRICQAIANHVLAEAAKASEVNQQEEELQ